MWQPIKTAPRDGTPVDLFHKIAGRLTDCWWDDDDKLWTCTLQGDEAFTHWMPIPEDPAVDYEGKEVILVG